jgi:two-component system, LytTR family, sensor kinase
LNLRPLITNFYLRNGLVWLVILAYCHLFAGMRATEITFKENLLNALYCTFLLFWDIFQNRVLYERFFLKNRLIVFMSGHVAGLFLFFVVATSLFNRQFTPEQFYANAFSYFNNFILATSVYLSYKHIVEKDALYRLTILRRDIELQQLKRQLNPHFLFNALNNIYSYTLESNRHGNELILKLSELMRFVLDSAEKESIPVQDEIRFVENYISFEKERLGERCLIHFHKKIMYPNRLIAPLLLFPFIENAFKYGTNTMQKTEIEILIEDNIQSLDTIVKNSIVNDKTISTKKGMSNSNRRLELLYPQKHKLDISIQDRKFVVDLSIELPNDTSINC